MLFCILFSNINSQIIPLRFDQAIYRLNQYKNFSSINLIKNIPYNFTSEQIFEYISILNLNNKTSQCEEDFKIILQSTTQNDLWAMKILDAWGKPLPSGILKGNIYWVGNYDECLQPLYDPTNKTFISQPFHTQHCTITPQTSQTNPNTISSIIFGICVPSSCNKQDVISLIHKYFKKTNLTENNLMCSNDPPNGQKNFTHGAIATMVILSLLGLLVFTGTIIDLILMLKINSSNHLTSFINGYNHHVKINESEKLSQYSKIKPYVEFFAEFSAIKTLRRIFTMKQKKDDSTFLFINGIRVLSLFWVIIGHSLAFGLSYASNVLDVLSWTHDISFQLIINAVLSVDTFFVLSGFLTAILFIREVEKEKMLSFRLMFFYYIHRYIRLTPTFLLVILVSINLTPYFGSGPLYPTKEGFEVSKCRTEYWWTSIVYVGNLVKSDQSCLPVSWYLHNDMQFHWIAPLSLIPFVIGRKSLAFFMSLSFVFTSILSIIFILLYYPNMSVNALIGFMDAPGPTFFKNIYITPWCRISAYAIGMLTGYIVNDVGRQYRMNKYIKIFGSILTVLIALACLFTTFPDYFLSSGLSRSILIAYQSLSRTFWSIVIGWILFLCSTNQGGLINKILSWPIWSPFSKLNYSCYLVHLTIIYIMLLNQTIPLYYQRYLFINNFVIHIFFSYVTAIVVTMFFETPFFIIEKKIFKR